MEFDLIIKLILGTGIGLIAWMLRSNMVKLNRLSVDIAVIKSTIEVVRDDHDSLILIKSKVDKCETDINNAFSQIRRTG